MGEDKAGAGCQGARFCGKGGRDGFRRRIYRAHSAATPGEEKGGEIVGSASDLPLLRATTQDYPVHRKCTHVLFSDTRNPCRMTPSPITRNRLKEIARLSRKRSRDEEGLFLIEGVRSVESAVRAGAPIAELLVTPEGLQSERVQAILQAAPGEVLEVSTSDMRKVADVQTAQGVLAVARIPPVDLKSMTGPLVVLDGIQDPGNVGTIIRTAAWFGAGGVVAGPGTADPYGPKAVRSAMGGLWDLRIAMVDDLVRLAVEWLEQGRELYAADLEGVPVAAWKPPAESILVLGSEAHGISDPLRSYLSGSVTVGSAPGRRGVESLNVSVAAGILLDAWLG